MGRQLSRREVLRLGLMSGGILLGGRVLSACGDGGAATTTTAVVPTTAAAQANGTAQAAVRSYTPPSGLTTVMMRDTVAATEAQDLGIVFSEMLDLTASDAVTALLADRVDAIQGGLFQVVNAHEQGHTDLCMFTTTMTSNSVLVCRPELEGVDVASLAGKSLGALPRTTASYADLRQIFAEQDVDLETHFECTFGDPALVAGLFQEGSLDLVATSEPHASRLIFEGFGVEYFGYGAEWERVTGTPLLSLGWLARRSWLEETDALEGLIEANAFAADQLINNVEAYDPELLGVPEEAVPLVFDRVPPIMVPRWTDAHAEGLQYRLDRAFELGLIPNAYKAEQLTLIT